MLSANAEEAIAALRVGELSEPVQVLEGIAIFRLTAQKPEMLRVFEDVRQRAEELWLRDRGEQEWQALVTALRSASDISVDTDYLLTLPEYVQ
jgi:parvulin-like peptidyl-prolyl isomerase